MKSKKCWNKENNVGVGNEWPPLFLFFRSFRPPFAIVWWGLRSRQSENKKRKVCFLTKPIAGGTKDQRRKGTWKSFLLDPGLVFSLAVPLAASRQSHSQVPGGYFHVRKEFTAKTWPMAWWRLTTSALARWATAVFSFLLFCCREPIAEVRKQTAIKPGQVDRRSMVHNLNFFLLSHSHQQEPTKAVREKEI